MQKFNKLSRIEMRRIQGGYVGTCTAKCGKDAKGHDIKVTCTGSGCTATDGEGCTGDVDHSCPSSDD